MLHLDNTDIHYCILKKCTTFTTCWENTFKDGEFKMKRKIFDLITDIRSKKKITELYLAFIRRLHADCNTLVTIM